MRDCAIRSLILLPGATLWFAGCSPNTPSAGAQASPAVQPAHSAQPTRRVQQAQTTPAAETAQQARAVQPYRLTATVQDLMNGIIDPSADVLWDSVAYIATTKGIEDRQPRTEEEWKAVRSSAITLIEAANLLSMPGRRVAAARGSTGTPPGRDELSHAEIQQRLDSTHDSFTLFARNLQDAALKALAAIDAKDAQRLMDAGGTIDEACEACHVTFWYPGQSHPGT